MKLDPTARMQKRSGNPGGGQAKESTAGIDCGVQDACNAVGFDEPLVQCDVTHSLVALLKIGESGGKMGALEIRSLAIAGVKCFISWTLAIQERHRVRHPFGRPRSDHTQALRDPTESTMTTKTSTHRAFRSREESIRWDETSPLTMSSRDPSRAIETRHGRFVGGTSDQVEVIDVDTGAVRVMILPTRGMSIWRMEAGGIRFGWKSPVEGPVHPSLVPVFDPSGIGWLEGFDELVVRCGLESNGAPRRIESGQLVYPLHGRIGNLPADSLSIEYDEASGRLEVIGEVLESRLFVKRLRLRVGFDFRQAARTWSCWTM